MITAPNIHKADCCGNCQHAWEYARGQIACHKHKEIENGFTQALDVKASDVCDDFVKRQG